MRDFKLFRLKNEMFFGNLLSNLIGVQVVEAVISRSISQPSAEIMALAARIDLVFVPLSFCLVGLAIIMYERPIRRYLEDLHHSRASTAPEALKARQRLLNEPFVLIGFNLTIWLVAALVYITTFHLVHPGVIETGRFFMQTLLVGMVTSIIAFFILERILQKRMVPHLFPEGGLYRVPKTLRIRIFIRIAALVVACNIIPCFAFLGAMRITYDSPLDPEPLLELVRSSVITNCLIFIGVGLLLTALVSSNLARPFGEIIQVLKGIKRGRLDRKVRVTSNDEIGYTGDVINDMTDGLRERETMRHSLVLAREVQQNLLPKISPAVSGLDIAGRSIYCDQTGGDYFDFLVDGEKSGERVGLVVGDVSGHGIPSALLMASARAFLRLRATLPGTSAQVVTDVNRQLTQDVVESGQFMTLFYLVIDPEAKSLTWVRAGHDPAIRYDPNLDRFAELSGPGVALGVDEAGEYVQNEWAGLSPGQIITLSTDGIWEACNAAGEMFGKKRLQEAIRAHSSGSAADIIEAIFDTLKQFQGGVNAADDLTLVVAKVEH